MSKKTREIIAQLTLEEKCRLCAQADGNFGRVPRLDLPGSVPQDNPRGGADYFRFGRPVEIAAGSQRRTCQRRNTG